MSNQTFTVTEDNKNVLTEVAISHVERWFQLDRNVRQTEGSEFQLEAYHDGVTIRHSLGTYHNELVRLNIRFEAKYGELVFTNEISGFSFTLETAEEVSTFMSVLTELKAFQRSLISVLNHLEDQK
jgi:hypothetical protein